MAVKILRSKLVAPKPLNRAVVRRRLVEMVEEADDAGLILLIAPAGYGKTTLAQQVLVSRPNGAYAWYHLDATDAHPDQFFVYLAAALQSALPENIGTLLGEDGAKTIENFCFALDQYRGPRVDLVFDNWEYVNHNPDIARVPPLLARSGGDRLTTIVASRVPPKFPTRRGQAHGNVLRLDASQLAFSLPECQEALRLRFGKNVDEESIERFWKETSGWCVSVGLLSLSHSPSDPAFTHRAPVPTGSDESFLDYFKEEVYDKLSPDFALFLCETSLFDSLSVDRCSAVITDPQKTNEFLDELARSAIPHVVLEQPGHYRLHALTRQAFRIQLEKAVVPGRFTDICRSTADCYIKEGLVFEAIGLFMEMGDYDRALELMDTKWSELYGQHGWTVIKKWLEDLPDTYQDDPAYIKTYSNVFNVSGDNKGAIAFMQDKLSPERFAEDMESFGSLWANYWWARVNTETGPHYDLVKKDHSTLEPFADKFSPTMHGIFHNTLGMAAHLELRLHEAVAHVEMAVELVEEPYERLRIIANQNRALYSHLLGESLTALDILKQARDDCARKSLQTQISRMFMLEANIHLAMGYFREALDDVDNCIAAMREHGGYTLQFDAYLGRFRGIALWYLGDRAEGLRLLAAAREPAREFNTMTGIEVDLLCEYYGLADGHISQSNVGQNILDQEQDSECRLVFLALQAVKSHLNNDIAQLGRFSTQICDIAQKHEMPQWIATGSFLLAMSLKRSKDKKRQIELLEQGLGNLSRIGWRSFPMANDILTSFVLVKTIRFGLEDSVTNMLLSTGAEIDLTPAFGAELDDDGLTEEESIRLWEAALRLKVRGLSKELKHHESIATENELSAIDSYREFLDHCGLPPLRIELLGGFSVISKGREIHFNRSSSRLLLQHLLVAHPKLMHEEELIEHLWPETDPEKSRANLRTAVKDLRKALDPYAVPRGPSYVVYIEEHYGLELPAGSRVDSMVFDDLIRECIRKEALSSVTTQDRIADFRLALDTYRGPLLPMLPYESFVVELRERLQALYQKGSLKLAELLIAAKGFDEAVTAVERALAYDQLWTDGVRMLLRIHAMNGEILKAMRAYRSYEKRLKDELDLPPDESIREFYEEMVGSGSV